MALTYVTLPVKYYPDPTKGKPVYNGSVYVGQPNLDPEIEANRVSVTLRQQDGNTVIIPPEAQPLTTGAGGVILHEGSAVTVLADGNYSIKVLDRFGAQIYYVDDVLEGAPVTGNQVALVFDTVEDLKAANFLSIGDLARTKGYYAAGDGGGATYLVAASQTVDGFGDHDLANGNVALLQSDGAVNVKQYGAKGDGVTDDTAAIQAAFSTLKPVEAPSGNYVLSDCVTLPTGSSGLSGDGMGKTVFIFTKESLTANDKINFSAFVLNTVDGATLQDFSLEYTGTFYVPGVSYFGSACGIYAYHSDNITLQRIEASGFNRAGISLNGIITLSSNNSVLDCRLHRNRVAGLEHEKQVRLLVQGNYLGYNGHVDDVGTGYGVTSLSGGECNHAQVVNNFTDHNYRKGIDFHELTTGIVSNNICSGDRAYGIFVSNSSHPIQSVTIEGNIIDHDPDFYIDVDDDEGAITPFFKGIYVASTGVDTETRAAFNITGNTINNIHINAVSSETYGVQFNSGSTGKRSEINISDNLMQGEDVTRFVYVDSSVFCEIDVSVIGNKMRGADVAQEGVYTAGLPTGNGGSSTTIKDNTLVVSSFGGAGIFTRRDYSHVSINGNFIEVSTHTTHMISLESSNNTTSFTLNDNTLLAATPDITKTIFWGTSDGRIENNRYNDYHLPNYTVTSDKANHVTTIISKDIAASTTTNILHIAPKYSITTAAVDWNAYAEYTATGASASVSGGSFVYLTAWTENNRTLAPAIVHTAKIDTNAGTGSTPMVTDWDLGASAKTDYGHVLQFTSDRACKLELVVREVRPFSSKLDVEIDEA